MASAKHEKPITVRRHPVKSIIRTMADVCIILGLIIGCFPLWLMFWTGIESSQEQNLQSEQSSSTWIPSNVDLSSNAKISKKQSGEPPVQQEPTYGEMLGQLYIPRFGSRWVRNLVQGTDYLQLARHGLGHYEGKAMPGQVGLFAVAGHRAGYGEPLAYIDKLQDGDYIVMRTSDYWYVYKYYDHKVVGKDDGAAISDVPFDPSATPKERLMALTTCEPRYVIIQNDAPYRWVAYAKFQYWAKVSDGTPKELLDTSGISTPSFSFSNTGNTIHDIAKYVPNKDKILEVLIAMYISMYMAALIAWRYLGIKEWKEEKRKYGIVFSPLGWVYRLQPGSKPIRILLMIVLTLILIGVCTMYVSPFAADNIPYLRVSAAIG